MKVNVTLLDISRGERHSPTSCPIALAVRRALRGTPGVSVSVGTKAVDIQQSTLIESPRLPPIARRFIKKFDGRGVVEPFSFELGAAEEGTDGTR
jgi:hypothetical protein